MVPALNHAPSHPGLGALGLGPAALFGGDGLAQIIGVMGRIGHDHLVR
jgi:hypothetical protein